MAAIHDKAPLSAKIPLWIAMSCVLFIVATCMNGDARFEGGAICCNGVVAVVCFAIGSVQWEKHRQKQEAGRTAFAEEVVRSLEGDRSPLFSLYLRPFVSTGALAKKNYDDRGYAPSAAFTPTSNELEQELEAACSELAPLVALGRPGEYDGAPRIASTDADWWPAAVQLMQRAFRIIVVPSHHEGTRMELEHIAAAGYLDKTLFVMPPKVDVWTRAAYGDVEAEWAKTAESLRELGIVLPPYDAAGALFRLLDREHVAKLEPLHLLTAARLEETIRLVE